TGILETRWKRVKSASHSVGAGRWGQVLGSTSASAQSVLHLEHGVRERPDARTEPFFIYTRARSASETSGSRVGARSDLEASWPSSRVNRRGALARWPAGVASFATMKLMAMGIYLALGDSISIDDYTGVRGGG